MRAHETSDDRFMPGMTESFFVRFGTPGTGNEFGPVDLSNVSYIRHVYGCNVRRLRMACAERAEDLHIGAHG
jgi:hypothetical protein